MSKLHIATVDDLVEAFRTPDMSRHQAIGELAYWAGVGDTAVYNWMAKDRSPPEMHMRIFLYGMSQGWRFDPEFFNLDTDDANLLAACHRSKCRAKSSSVQR